MATMALLLNVGGTQMAVNFADHFNAPRADVSTMLQAMVTCGHCGALTVDYEVHLVWHVERGELTITGGGGDE